jgi:trimethylamine:corrinoid methyltransferase-like protein
LSGGKPVGISVGMFPFDVRHAWVAGGMPEHTLIEAQRAQITRRYDPGIVYSHSMTTAAHMIGVQSGLEKAANAQTAALLGCRDFNTIGLLGFDDIFSPEQCLLDVEALALIEANIRPASPTPQEAWADWISEGLAHGYIGADETLERYMTVQHLPLLLDRRALSAKHGEPAGYDWTRNQAQTLAQDYIRQHQSYEPRGLEDAMRIYDQAWRQFGDGKNPLARMPHDPL